VNEWSPALLAVIAVSTAVMAVMQIGAFVVLARVAVQVRDIVATLQTDVRPLIARANQIAEEASRTAAIATAQAEKIDRLVTDLTRRVDETSVVVQQAIITPAREGMAIVAALKAGLGALKGARDMRGRAAGVDEEDALFIG
jgi:predicted PurR-regulated permease PerM